MIAIASGRPRSWLFAPGHNEVLLGKVFATPADAVVLDLEDSVPVNLKDRARQQVREAAAHHACWVRINKPRTDECRRDIEALKGLVRGFRLPKVESKADVEWVAKRAPGVALDCTIESARGVASAQAIADCDACRLLSYGSVDLSRDLGIDARGLAALYARSAIVIAARAAGKPPPSDGVYTQLQDHVGLRLEAEEARSLGFFGKSAIHPRQVATINEVFTPSSHDIEWAKQVLAAYELAGGAATTLPDGQFIDLPVAERARALLRFRSREGT